MTEELENLNNLSGMYQWTPDDKRVRGVGILQVLLYRGLASKGWSTYRLAREYPPTTQGGMQQLVMGDLYRDVPAAKQGFLDYAYRDYDALQRDWESYKEKSVLAGFKSASSALRIVREFLADKPKVRGEQSYEQCNR